MDIVSLKYDYLFKYLMQNPVIRRHFISDVLDIPMEEIKAVRLASPYLWKSFYRQKQGILDILLLLNDNSKINVELQVRMIRHWSRRALFYLSKTFTEDLLFGQSYIKLKKCIHISILDFNLDNDPEYHRSYRLRDRNGREFSDLLEVHIVELQKKLHGPDRIDNWIRLFNAKTEEDLDMIQTDNPGILTAIKELKAASLTKTLRALYDGHMKQLRDQNARDEYVREEGIAIGRSQGEVQGEYITLINQVRKKLLKHISSMETAELLETDPAVISKIYKILELHPDWSNKQIGQFLTDAKLHTEKTPGEES